MTKTVAGLTAHGEVAKRAADEAAGALSGVAGGAALGGVAGLVLGFGAMGPHAFDHPYKRDFNVRYRESGYTYRQIAPAYRYGRDLAASAPFRGQDWQRIEPLASSAWEERNPGTWDQVREAVQYGFSEPVAK